MKILAAKHRRSFARHPCAKSRAAAGSSRLAGKCQALWEWGNGIRAAVENPGWIIKGLLVQGQPGMENSGTSPWKC